MTYVNDRACLAYDIENTFGGSDTTRKKIEESDLAYRSTQVANIRPGVPVLMSTAMSRTFANNRRIDLQPAAPYLGVVRFVKGRDAADLYLIDVLYHDPAVLRSSDIVIASGDKKFLPAVNWLRHQGRKVHLYARKSATSPYVLNQFDSVTWAPEIGDDDSIC